MHVLKKASNLNFFTYLLEKVGKIGKIYKFQRFFCSRVEILGALKNDFDENL